MKILINKGMTMRTYKVVELVGSLLLQVIVGLHWSSTAAGEGLAWAFWSEYCTILSICQCNVWQINKVHLCWGGVSPCATVLLSKASSINCLSTKCIHFCFCFSKEVKMCSLLLSFYRIFLTLYFKVQICNLQVALTSEVGHGSASVGW